MRPLVASREETRQDRPEGVRRKRRGGLLDFLAFGPMISSSIPNPLEFHIVPHAGREQLLG